jgi:outer membrane protein OmpA-like peptidoglycan-associated protein
LLQRTCACGTHAPGGGECEECKKKRLQRQATGAHTPNVAPPIVHDVLRAPGQPLDAGTRAFMEPRFGHDFSRVRVHTDPAAAASARAVGALAYTVGPHIAFGAGQYAPGTPAGQRLLAHELTHTIQQSASNAEAAPMASAIAVGGVDDAYEREAETQAARVTTTGGADRMSVKGRLGAAGIQRQADISQAPPGLACGLVTGSGPLPGTQILFDQSSGSLSVASRALIATFADTWIADGGHDAIQIDGYASVDGPQALNWRLSCERAESVRAELVAQGVPAAQISLAAHGETTDFSATDLTQNRRAIIFRNTAPAPAPAPTSPAPTPTTPTTPAPSVPQLSPTIVTGPTAGNCGVMNFVIRWNLSANAGPQGGFIIQDITITWNNRDCANVEIPDASGKISPLRYFEAWRVAPNSRTLSPVSTDTFSWANDLPSGCTIDRVRFRGIARYHDNVAALPAHMVANNPNTFAGTLQSSLTDPALGGNISAPVPHNLTFNWTCCPCAANPTIVESHTP